MVEKSPGETPAAGSIRWGIGETRQVTAAPFGGDDAGTDLTRALIELVHSTDVRGGEFYARLAGLEAQYGQEVFSQLIFLLCHLKFEPGEANSHWNRIVEHRVGLEESWGSPIDPRVALVSYFLQVHPQLDNPTIIEMQLLEETRAYAYRDELTGLRNFRFFELYLFHELLHSDQYSSPLSLILVDIDDFKRYNDQLGHAAGNEALAAVGRLISESCRRVDVPARYGGEEFAIILPTTPKLGARTVADRVRESIEEHMGSAGSGSGLTVCAGVATYPGDADSSEELIRRADEALYRAKSKGKNRVELYGEDRRSWERVQTRLTGRLVAPSSEPRSLTTIDISMGGLRFLTDVELPNSALVDLRLVLPGHDHEIEVGGRVVKCSPSESGGHDTAIRIVDLSARDRRTLGAYLQELAAAGEDRA